MSTNIAERAQFARFAANDNDIVSTDVCGHEVTAIRNVVDMANELPATEKQRLVFELEQLRI